MYNPHDLNEVGTRQRFSTDLTKWRTIAVLDD